MSDWSNYVKRVAGSDTSAAIAEKTGINQSSIYRWMNNDATPSPAHAAKFATTYRHNVLDAFIAAGFVTDDDIRPERNLQEDLNHLDRDLMEARVALQRAEMQRAEAGERMDQLTRKREALVAELAQHGREAEAAAIKLNATDSLLENPGRPGTPND